MRCSHLLLQASTHPSQPSCSPLSSHQHNPPQHQQQARPHAGASTPAQQQQMQEQLQEMVHLQEKERPVHCTKGPPAPLNQLDLLPQAAPGYSRKQQQQLTQPPLLPMQPSLPPAAAAAAMALKPQSLPLRSLLLRLLRMLSWPPVCTLQQRRCWGP